MELKQIRESKGLTQEQLAEQIKVTVQTVSRWERGVYSPSLEQYIALCRVFGYEVMEAVKFGGRSK